MKNPLLGAGIVLVSLGAVLSTSALLNLYLGPGGPAASFALGGPGGIFLTFGILILLTRRREKWQVPLAAIAPQPASQASTPKVCPTCGLLYGPEAQFCQKDATPLASRQAS